MRCILGLLALAGAYVLGRYRGEAVLDAILQAEVDHRVARTLEARQ